jgi:hypothetical protein
VSDALATGGRTTPPGLAGERFSPRVLMVALARDYRVKQDTERVGIPQRANPHIALQRPQRDLDRMPGATAITTGKPVRMLRPQLPDAMLMGEILTMLDRIAQTRTTVSPVRRHRLVLVLHDQQTTRIALDCEPALAQLIRDRPTPSCVLLAAYTTHGIPKIGPFPGNS